MKKRILSALVSLSVIVGVLPVYVHASDTKTIKNIIYMIPDGGGYPLYDFANVVKQQGGFSKSIFPNKTPVTAGDMYLRDYLVGSVKTAPHSSSGDVTDSAAAGTALATGVKTVNGYLGIDSNKKPRANILEAAQSKGKATGLVATYEWTHATPGAFSAHAIDRNDYKNIYQQIENQDIEVVLGAGYGAVESYGGTLDTAINNGYKIISKKSDVSEVKPSDKLWGNIANPSLPYDVQLSSDMPNIAQMTEAAITALSGDEDGFFLMVEGSKVDSGGHANDAVVTTSEYLAFDAAFAVALEFAKGRDDTLIVCVPDHDTGGMLFTGASKMVKEVAAVINGSDPSSIGWTSGGHTAQNVPVWMYVPEGVKVIDGLNNNPGDTTYTRNNCVIDNTKIAPYLADLIGVNLDQLTDELYTDVTKIGKFNAMTGKYEFGSGNKYVYVNDSVYYEDGKEISMNGKVSLCLNGRFYVPAEIIDDVDWEYVDSNGGFAGSGTKNDPYIISGTDDFIDFTSMIMMGETFNGKYFKQDADIDLSGVEEYQGVGKAYTFAGTYDGKGHTINIDIDTNTDGALFPYVEGTIMNLGTTGSIKTTADYTGGIARSVRSSAKVVNCYSTVKINCVSGGGITASNYGKIVNTYFGGTITGTGTVGSFAYNNSGIYDKCYYNNAYAQTGMSGLKGMSLTELKSADFLQTLNEGRSSAAVTVSLEEKAMSHWVQDESGLPYLYSGVPIVTEVIITPKTVTLKKGEGMQFKVEVLGEFDPSSEVLWSMEPASEVNTIIHEDGYLVIDTNETLESFVVMAKSKQDGSKADTCVVTVSNEVVSEDDGSRERPYLIKNEQDFFDFTSKVLAGNTYEGKYIKQTADIDMADYPEYVGMGSAVTFAGVYDGGGHTINLKLASKDGCAFPYLTGTILNLGTTGEVINETYAAGICRSVRQKAKIVNCWSSCKIEGSRGNRTGGIACSTSGIVANCCYFGEIMSGGYDIAASNTGSVRLGNYYLGTEYVKNTTNTEITKEQLINVLYIWLNEGISNAASKSGVLIEDIKHWLPKDGSGPVIVQDGNTLFGIANNQIFVYPNVNLNNADVYIAVYDESGNLLSVETEKLIVSRKNIFVKSLEYNYTPEDNVKIMLWNGITPIEEPVYY